MTEIMKHSMKNRKIIIIVGWLMLSRLSISAFAQQQEWQSTSAMKGTGSAYSPQVTAVGAPTATSEAVTTETYSPAKAASRPRRLGEFDDSPEVVDKDEDYPLGDGLLPLLMMAATFGGVIAFRRRRTAKTTK